MSWRTGRNDITQDTTDKKPIIAPEMTIPDIVSRYRHTEAVFKQYDEKAGVCLCCQALFDPLEEVAHRYGLDLAELMADLEIAARGDSKPFETGVVPIGS